MTRLKIAVDFDDTVVDTMTEWCRLANTHYHAIHGHLWKPEDFTDWGIAERTGLSEEVVGQIFDKIDYRKVSHIRDAVRNIRFLVDDGHTVAVVTANPHEAKVRAWMDRNGLRTIKLVSTPDKVSHLIRVRGNVIVDDNPKTLQGLANAGQLAIRMIKPWNDIMNWGSQENEKSAPWWSVVYSLITGYAQKRRYDPELRAGAYRTIELGQEKYYMTGMYDEALSLIEQKLGDLKMPEEPVITNARGGKQSDIGARYDLLPALAVKEVAAVLQRGAKKYGEANWHMLSVEEIHNHTLGHAVAFNRSNSIEDLAHTATRALMALEIALREAQSGN